MAPWSAGGGGGTASSPAASEVRTLLIPGFRVRPDSSAWTALSMPANQFVCILRLISAVSTASPSNDATPLDIQRIRVR